MWDNPMVALNHAIATAMVPAGGGLDGSTRWRATRGWRSTTGSTGARHLLERAGDRERRSGTTGARGAHDERPERDYLR